MRAGAPQLKVVTFDTVDKDAHEPSGEESANNNPKAEAKAEAKAEMPKHLVESRPKVQEDCTDGLKAFRSTEILEVLKAQQR